jgi:radical SAM superfamily enzyme YgiQ (UPF0313 family)
MADLAQRLRRRRQHETSLVEPNQGGRLRVVLAYPNTYAVGMSNLGLHTVYRLLNAHPEVFCERAFLPDDDEIEEYLRRGTPLMTVESQRPVSDADVIAFSASFENDYVNVVRMLRIAGLPARSEARDERHPLVLMGGATVSINPEPVAPFLDACCVGEGEEIVGPLIEAVITHAGTDAPRDALLERLAQLPGLYVPSLYEPQYTSEGNDYAAFTAITAQRGAPATVQKVRAAFDGLESVAATSILTPDTELGDRIMIEVARGCTKGCRYCWVGYNVLPFRVHAVDDVLAAAERWRAATSRVGLVATALLDHPDIEAIASGLRERDFDVFSPSLIISTLREPLLRAVIDSGQRSITVAPETGSDRLRELIMKRITNREILEKVRLIFRAGARSLKNYVIIGLPGETEQDLEDLVELATGMRRVMIEEGRARGSIGTITLSVNCLIPKPATPFQWAEQIRPAEYRRKLKWLRRRLGKVPNVEIEAMPPRTTEIQALMSRGDRRVADLVELWAEGGSWRDAVRDWEARGGSLEHFAYRPLSPGTPLPWAHLRTGAAESALSNQWYKAMGGGVDAAA